MSNKLHNMAPLLEFVVGAGLAVFFHWVLHYEEAAYMIFGVGILLSLVTYLLREDLANWSDSISRDYHNAHELTFAVAQITDPECHAKAQELLAAVKKDLSLLQQGYILLDETEFYLAAAKAVDQVSHLVRAVDTLTSGWDTKGALVNFYHANLRALARKIRIIRVFVLDRDQFQVAETQRILLTQLRDGIDVRIAHRDELPSAADGSSWASHCSFDFALYDDRVATEVDARADGHYGRKTSQPLEVSKYQHLYDLIEHNSHGLVLQEDTVLLAGAAGASPPV